MAYHQHTNERFSFQVNCVCVKNVNIIALRSLAVAAYNGIYASDDNMALNQNKNTTSTSASVHKHKRNAKKTCQKQSEEQKKHKSVNDLNAVVLKRNYSNLCFLILSLFCFRGTRSIFSVVIFFVHFSGFLFGCFCAITQLFYSAIVIQETKTTTMKRNEKRWSWWLHRL